MNDSGRATTPTPVGFSQPDRALLVQLFQSIAAVRRCQSPHVAGLFALLKAGASPDWSACHGQVGLVTRASYQDGVTKEDGVTAADPFDMGAGRLDPRSEAGAENSIFKPGVVYDAGFNEYLGSLRRRGPKQYFTGSSRNYSTALDPRIPTDADDLEASLRIRASELAGVKLPNRGAHDYERRQAELARGRPPSSWERRPGLRRHRGTEEAEAGPRRERNVLRDHHGHGAVVR